MMKLALLFAAQLAVPCINAMPIVKPNLSGNSTFTGTQRSFTNTSLIETPDHHASQTQANGENSTSPLNMTTSAQNLQSGKEQNYPSPDASFDIPSAMAQFMDDGYLLPRELDQLQTLYSKALEAYQSAQEAKASTTDSAEQDALNQRSEEAFRELVTFQSRTIQRMLMNINEGKYTTIGNLQRTRYQELLAKKNAMMNLGKQNPVASKISSTPLERTRMRELGAANTAKSSPEANEGCQKAVRESLSRLDSSTASNHSDLRATIDGCTSDILQNSGDLLQKFLSVVSLAMNATQQMIGNAQNIRVEDVSRNSMLQNALNDISRQNSQMMLQNVVNDISRMAQSIEQAGTSVD